MLNEVSAAERATTQGLVTIFISIGQMLGGAIIGAVTASEKGMAGYQNLFLYLAVMILAMALFSFRLKSRKVELATSVRE
jgi:MFS family permease